MYDPLIVDTFIAVHTELSLDLSENVIPRKEAISRISRSIAPTQPQQPESPLEDIIASTEESQVLYDLARALSGPLDLTEAGDIVAKHIRRMIPASTCVFYVYDPSADELQAAHAAGEGAGHFAGIRIPRGQRLSGWVAANKQTIMNSDPVLDLGEVARVMRPRPRSCLSTPLVSEGELLGVLTLYTSDREAFSENHRRVIEIVAREVVHAIKGALNQQTNLEQHASDRRTTLPNVHQLERLVASELSNGGKDSTVSLIFVRFEPLKPVKSPLQHQHDEREMRTLIETVSKALRSADVLFERHNDEFVALLTDTGFDAAAAVANRIASGVTELRSTFHSHADVRMQVTLSVATAPSDGMTVTDLSAAALNRKGLGPFSLNSISPSVH
jgi:diguanylate cyclase (GGDEF)-like protein